MVIPTMNLQAGNEDRAGSAGSTELLVNPWTRSSGWGDAGISSIIGLEAMFTNVAGLAYADQTEIIFSRTNWLGTMTGIGLNGAGLAPDAPFGGYKHSGIGREAGKLGLEEYLEVKAVSGWND